MVLARAFLVAGLASVELTLRVIIEGLAAGFLGAPALSARVIRFAAGDFIPLSGS